MRKRPYRVYLHAQARTATYASLRRATLAAIQDAEHITHATRYFVWHASGRICRMMDVSPHKVGPTFIDMTQTEVARVG